MKQIHQRQEHTGSYYAATVTEITDYPVLEGAKTAMRRRWGLYGRFDSVDAG
jgi:hypothetical protein